MRNNRHAKTKKLKVRIQNAGLRKHFAQAVQTFALDLHTTGLFEKVSVNTDLKPDYPGVHIKLTPVQSGTAPLFESEQGCVHVEEIRLSGKFNFYTGPRGAKGRAFEMTLTQTELRGYLPDAHPDASRKVWNGRRFASGKLIEVYKGELLPKESRATRVMPDADKIWVRMLAQNAGEYFVSRLIAAGYMKGNLEASFDAPLADLVPQESKHALRRGQRLRRDRHTVRATGQCYGVRRAGTPRAPA